MKKSFKVNMPDQQTIGSKVVAEQTEPERGFAINVTIEQPVLKRCAVLEEFHWEIADHMDVLKCARRWK